MVLWHSPQWPEFQVDLAALQPALADARYAQGRAMGLASHLQRMDLGDLQLQGWANEAIAQIEGEILQVNSVRASAARRLGLKDAKALERDARTEATLDVLQAATGQANMDVTPWVQSFVGCVHKAADATWEHLQTALRKIRFWAELREQQLQLTPTQTKAINKLFDAGPDDFANGIGTEKYVNLCRVSRATAYRELPALCEMGVLVQTGIGRGTRYRLQLGEGCGLY